MLNTANHLANDNAVLIVPYQWIGDFVRCHSVVKVLKSLDNTAPIDILTSVNNAPLLDYMPGVRKGIVWDLPRRRIAFPQHCALARRLRDEAYARALVMPRTWKAALAPFLAGIPQRSGFVGEWRFGILNDLRRGEKQLPRMIDQCAALALPPDAKLPAEWPMPELRVPGHEISEWRVKMNLPEDGHRVVALAPGAVGPSKRWTASGFIQLTKDLAADNIDVWIVGGPGEKEVAQEICAVSPNARDLTGTDLRNAILALAAANVAVSNDSGLLHVAAATGTPSIGIFGPTSPWHWAPLNPLAAIVQADIELDCQPCHRPVCALGHHLCMREIGASKVLRLVHAALDNPSARVTPRREPERLAS
jgi:heptosyltransferase-2